MAKTPTQKLVDDAEQRDTHTVTDAKGRVIVFKPMPLLESARLARAIGSEHSTNSMFMFIAQVACSVESIDAVPVPRSFRNLLAVDAAIERLGDDGYNAITAYAQKNQPKEGEEPEE